LKRSIYAIGALPLAHPDIAVFGHLPIGSSSNVVTGEALVSCRRPMCPGWARTLRFHIGRR